MMIFSRSTLPSFMLLSTVVLVSLSAVLVGAADTVDVSNSFAKQRHSIDVKGKKELGKHTTVTIHDSEGDVGDEEGIFELKEVLPLPAKSKDLQKKIGEEGDLALHSTKLRGSTASIIATDNLNLGQYSKKFMLINPATGKALDVNGAHCNAENNVHLWHANYSAAQIFHYHYDTKAIVNVKCDMAIDIHAGSCEDDANIQIYPKHGQSNQGFVFLNDGSIMSAKCHGKVIDVAGGASEDGTNILSWTWHGGDNQIWKINYVWD